MTGQRQPAHSLPDLEHGERTRRPRGPVTFSDDELLQRRLERRNVERRRLEGEDDAARALSPDLGARELCHDLRQPLASAVLLTHMLEKDADLTDAHRQRLGMLHAELRRLADMLTAQLESTAPELVDVAAVVRSVCGAPVADAVAPVQLLVEETPLVRGDPVQLARMVANLVTNARAAAGPGGAVRVLVGGAGSAARVTVEDSGGAVREAPAPGFGLGLMIVDSVLRRHGGTSACTASPLGGLRMSVTIPAAVRAQGVLDDA